MKLLSKLTLLSLGVSAIPLAIAGYSSLRIGQGALRGAIEDNELAVAKQVADHVGGELHHLASILRVDAHIFDLTRSGEAPPTAQGLLKFLQLVYHQSDDFCAIALFDEHGAPVGQPAYMENPASYESFRNHEPMRPIDVESLGLMAPLGDAMNRGQGAGPVFLGGPRRVPHVVLAVAFDPTLGGGKKILAAEVSLRRLGEYVASVSTGDSDVELVDGGARLIASGSRGGIANLEVQSFASAREGELPQAETVAEYQAAGRRVIGAYAPVDPFAFGVVVNKTLDAALVPVNRIRFATLFWIGVSGVVGSLVARAFAHRLSERVELLAAGSRQIASGNLEARIPEDSSDELSDLAQSFNGMAASLHAARAQILTQTKEIMVWNETLEKRVEDGTRELRQAQDMLLRSRSLAALGELGAGVAHEINNPLAGVLGIAQLMLADLPAGHPARPMAQDIEAQALRIRKIVSNLLRFAQRQAGEDAKPIDITRVLDDALELCGPSDLTAAGIELVRRYATSAPPVRGNAVQLQEAFIQLIRNARAAMDGGGTLTIATTVPDDKLLRVTISDTGHGIDPAHLPRIFDPFFTTKGDWAGIGMGLSVVHKTVEDHGGSIEVDSDVDKGTRFVLTFPTHVRAGAARLS
ncbi:MAG TPA: ATP-binding protein [Polyangia bacterium]|jgi:signal transduction histidine kinase|nr:ATP-binding protein [Polyangia bacterium]